MSDAPRKRITISVNLLWGRHYLRRRKLKVVPLWMSGFVSRNRSQAPLSFEACCVPDIETSFMAFLLIRFGIEADLCRTEWLIFSRRHNYVFLWQILIDIYLLSPNSNRANHSTEVMRGTPFLNAAWTGRRRRPASPDPVLITFQYYLLRFSINISVGVYWMKKLWLVGIIMILALILELI